MEFGFVNLSRGKGSLFDRTMVMTRESPKGLPDWRQTCIMGKIPKLPGKITKTKKTKKLMASLMMNEKWYSSETLAFLGYEQNSLPRDEESYQLIIIILVL